MKATGIVRKIDDLGRIVLPMELRRVLGLEEGASLEIFTEEDTIVLRRYQPVCVFCGSRKDLVTYRRQCVCEDCRRALGYTKK